MGIRVADPSIPLQMGSTAGWDSMGHMAVVMEIRERVSHNLPTLSPARPNRHPIDRQGRAGLPIEVAALRGSDERACRTQNYRARGTGRGIPQTTLLRLRGYL